MVPPNNGKNNFEVRSNIDSINERLASLTASRQELGENTAKEIFGNIIDSTEQKDSLSHSLEYGVNTALNLLIPKSKWTKELAVSIQDRVVYMLQQLPKEGLFIPYIGNMDSEFTYDQSAFDHLFEQNDSIDVEEIKKRFESKYNEEARSKLAFNQFLVKILILSFVIELEEEEDKVINNNAYGYNKDYDSLTDSEKEEFGSKEEFNNKKKEIFNFFQNFTFNGEKISLIPEDLVFDSLEDDYDFFAVAFHNLFTKLDELGDEEKDQLYAKFIDEYSDLLGKTDLDARAEVELNLDQYFKFYVKKQKVDELVENEDSFADVVSILEKMQEEEEELEEKEKKEKKEKEEKLNTDVLAAISGTADYSDQNSSEIVGGYIVEQLDPPPYIQEIIKEGRIDDEGNYVCSLDDHGVYLVFSQDEDTNGFRLKIEDQNEKYEPENISFDSSNLKEVMWDKVEYNIDKINSIAVISDLGLSPFFKSGSELKMMQFVHLMVATNVKTITGSEPKDWYRNSNKKDMPLLNRSAAVRYIKKFFGLEGQNNITEKAWRGALVYNGLLDKSGEILPMRKIAVNKDFLTAKQKFSASFDSKAEEANRDDA